MHQSEETLYGVFYHHVCRELNPSGGIVVRKIDGMRRAHDSFNYGGVAPLRVFKTERGADNYVSRRVK